MNALESDFSRSRIPYSDPVLCNRDLSSLTQIKETASSKSWSESYKTESLKNSEILGSGLELENPLKFQILGIWIYFYDIPKSRTLAAKNKVKNF